METIALPKFKKNLHLLDDLFEELNNNEVEIKKEITMKDLHEFNATKIYLKQQLINKLPIEIINIILKYMGNPFCHFTMNSLFENEYKYTYTRYGLIKNYAYKYHRYIHECGMNEGLLFEPWFQDIYSFMDNLEEFRNKHDWYDEEDSLADYYDNHPLENERYYSEDEDEN